MGDTYIENEIKILAIEVTQVTKRLEELGAQKMFDDVRNITSYDYQDVTKKSLRSQGTHLKITEKGKTKLSVDGMTEDGIITSVKNRIGRKKEMEATLKILGIVPVAQVEARRISYEIGDIDCDIDVFPEVPPFIEIDGNNSREIEEMIGALDLHKSERITGSTIQLHRFHDVDYFSVYK